jgi:hypothetical protein
VGSFFGHGVTGMLVVVGMLVGLGGWLGLGLRGRLAGLRRRRGGVGFRWFFGLTAMTCVTAMPGMTAMTLMARVAFVRWRGGLLLEAVPACRRFTRERWITVERERHVLKGYRLGLGRRRRVGGPRRGNLARTAAREQQHRGEQGNAGAKNVGHGCTQTSRRSAHYTEFPGGRRLGHLCNGAARQLGISAAHQLRKLRSKLGPCSVPIDSG